MAKKTVWYSKGMGAGGGGFYTLGEAKDLLKLNKKMGAWKTTFTRIRRKK